MCMTTSPRDTVSFPDRKQVQDDSSLLIDRRDSDGRPVGIGGARRRLTIDEIVDQAQRGKR